MRGSLMLHLILCVRLTDLSQGYVHGRYGTTSCFSFSNIRFGSAHKGMTTSGYTEHLLSGQISQDDEKRPV
ncbi:hypothetical protein IWX48DRAFT_615783 [Phyllosticta citricarpa]